MSHRPRARHVGAAIPRRTALAAIGAALGLTGLGCHREPRRPRVDAPAADRALVSVAVADDHVTAIDRALASFSTIDDVVRGDTVVLKVNSNSGDPSPYSTSPVLVAHLAKRLRDRGAEVLVGDRSFWGDHDPAGNLERNGIAGAARSAGARLVVFDDSVSWIEIPPHLVPHWNGTVRVPRVSVEAHHLMNLACLKTHFITGATLSLKNALGLVHADDRARVGNLRTHDPDLIHVQVAEINRFVRPALNLIDGHLALVAGGPTPTSSRRPKTAHVRTVVASTDRVAADAMGIALLRRHTDADDPLREGPIWQNRILRAATLAGVGIDAPHAMDCRGRGVEAWDELEADARSLG